MCVKIRFSALSGATVLGFGCICASDLHHDHGNFPGNSVEQHAMSCTFSLPIKQQQLTSKPANGKIDGHDGKTG
jgi:hypothetical protein